MDYRELLRNYEPLDEEFSDAVADAFMQAHYTLLMKHRDYGPKNISNAPGGAINGLLVRMHDKLARAEHLTHNNGAPNYESLEDTFMDLANYSIIAMLVLREKWPK